MKLKLFLAGWLIFCLCSQLLAKDNIIYSSRAYVAPSEGISIDKIILEKTHKLLIRVKAPSLGGEIHEVLPDPVLEVYSQSTLVGSNDNWQDGRNASEIIALGLAPQQERESALMEVFRPGTYTLKVSSKNNDRGVVLLEVIDLGEVKTIYDDFNGGSLNSSLWIVRQGNPVVEGGYLYCKTAIPSKCSIESLAKSLSWGVTIQSPSDVSDGNLVIKVLLGKIQEDSLWGAFEIDKAGLVYAYLIRTDTIGNAKEVILREFIEVVTPQIFLSLNWDPFLKRIDFIYTKEGYSSYKSLGSFVSSLDLVFDELSLQIYTYGDFPITNIYPIGMVEY